MPMPPPSPAGGLPCPTVSHEQLEVTGTKAGLYVKVVGKRRRRSTGRRSPRGSYAATTRFVLVAEAVLLCVLDADGAADASGRRPAPAVRSGRRRGIPGESAASWELRRLVDVVAASSEDVLVRGESGSGKTAVARAIHFRSSRRNGPIVKRSAKQFTETLVEGQLFGTAKGVVGAGKQTFEGLFPEAEGGTILFDEIGLAPLWLQEMLLATLDDGVYTVVGGREAKVDARIVGTTNEDPKRVLRFDLDARLAQRVNVPPVRERRDDIGFILRHFLEAADKTAKGDLPSKRRISPTFVDFLVATRCPRTRVRSGTCWQRRSPRTPRGT